MPGHFTAGCRNACPTRAAERSLDSMSEHSWETQLERLTTRVSDLEVLFTHLQRTVGELDQVILAQQRQIDGLERKLLAMGSEVTAIAAHVADERKPEDEKPPHY